MPRFVTSAWHSPGSEGSEGSEIAVIFDLESHPGDWRRFKEGVSISLPLFPSTDLYTYSIYIYMESIFAYMESSIRAYPGLSKTSYLACKTR